MFFRGNDLFAVLIAELLSFLTGNIILKPDLGKVLGPAIV